MTTQPEVKVEQVFRKADRPTRKKFNNEGRCKFPDLPGYKLYLVNSSAKGHAHKLQDMKNAWWEPVLNKELYGSECEHPNDLVKVNDPDEPMLVKLPEDIHKQDKADFHLENDRIYQERLNKREPGQFGSINVSIK